MRRCHRTRLAARERVPGRGAADRDRIGAPRGGRRHPRSCRMPWPAASSRRLVVGDRPTPTSPAPTPPAVSLMVLTGVNNARDAVGDPAGSAPTTSARICGHCSPTPTLWRSPPIPHGRPTSSTGPSPSAPPGMTRRRRPRGRPAVARAVWGRRPALVQSRAADDAARSALDRWSLLTDADQLA